MSSGIPTEKPRSLRMGDCVVRDKTEWGGASLHYRGTSSLATSKATASSRGQLYFTMTVIISGPSVVLGTLCREGIGPTKQDRTNQFPLAHTATTYRQDKAPVAMTLHRCYHR